MLNPKHTCTKIHTFVIDHHAHRQIWRERKGEICHSYPHHHAQTNERKRERERVRGAQNVGMGLSLNFEDTN